MFRLTLLIITPANTLLTAPGVELGEIVFVLAAQLCGKELSEAGLINSSVLLDERVGHGSAFV